MEKKKRGRPADGDTQRLLTMKLVEKISKSSGKTSAQLEFILLEDVGGKSALGASWNRYKRGDRSLSPDKRHLLFEKAKKLGYLKTSKSLSNNEFGYLSQGVSLGMAKTLAFSARAKDRAATKMVAEARSALRRLRELLETREEYEWNVYHSKYERKQLINDDAFEVEFEELYIDKNMMMIDLKELDDVLSSLRFDALATPGDEWLKSLNFNNRKSS